VAKDICQAFSCQEGDRDTWRHLGITVHTTKRILTILVWQSSGRFQQIIWGQLCLWID
jgi:hypothetical protein